MAMDYASTSTAGLSYQNVGDYYPRKLGPKPDVVPCGVTERKVSPLDKPDMVAVDVISINEPDIPLHRKKQETDTYVLSSFHPFRRTHRSFLGKFKAELRLVMGDRRSWRILLFGLLNVICTGCLLMWCSSTNSMGPGLRSSEGERDGGIDVSVQLFLQSVRVIPEAETELCDVKLLRLWRLWNMSNSISSQACDTSGTASSSLLQEHVADLSRSLCGMVPGLSSVLLPRMNPFILIDLAGALALCITYALIEINDYSAVDTASAVAIALMTFSTMYPMSLYSGKVLLQTTPSHVIGQLDKLLREVSTLDGVLEVRNEHFWTIGFGSLAGSVHVRIRRDASEQMVLAHVTSRLSTLVTALTVQIFKDDWTRPSLATGVLPVGAMTPVEYGVPSGPPKPSEEADPLTSTPSKLSSPPPEFSFNTPGRNVNPLILPSAHQHRPHSLGLAYGASPYGSMLGLGLARPGGAPGVPPAQGFRTALGSVPHRYGTQPGSTQFGLYRT
ncbi:hypothetical protein SKAU_G00149430 [Synaphobranchus kaupii]|uniref:Cation efflux protein transmembrane domain-containing protein n=1 Tax=Synaphobranchus kaupii TaxID=118154 RepID=A0A9Q1FTW3_SYNKA|nr:hypothetical protein SKAU_G00149430 [Synaphobranchus kaupii]